MSRFPLFSSSSTSSSKHHFSSGASTSSSSASSFGLTHVSRDNKPTMVDVGDKAVTQRTAWARSTLYLPETVANLLEEGQEENALRRQSNRTSLELVGPKGPVIATAIIAGTMAVKNTSQMIPFCHPLPIDSCKFDIFMKTDLELCEPKQIVQHAETRDTGATLVIDCKVKVDHKTGVEMEALTGASLAALTIYDMCKALSHDIVITSTRLMSKTGGKSCYLSDHA